MSRLRIPSRYLLHAHLCKDSASGLGPVLPGTSSYPSALRPSFDKLEQEIKTWVDKAKLAA